MTLRLSPSVEDAGVTPFADLIAAHYHPNPPEDVRDRIALPATSPEVIHDAVCTAVRGFTRRPGRHNRYVAVPGEASIRTDDVLDFLECYGHEYQLCIFRAVDIRTGSRLNVGEVHAATRAQGSACAWDWTGASDWLTWDQIPADAAFVFWNAYTSLIDGVEIAAGYWIPGEGEPPAQLSQRPSFTPEQQETMRARVKSMQLFADPQKVGHPGIHDPGLPVLVLTGEDLERSGADDAWITAGARALVRTADHMSIVPSAQSGESEA